MRERFFSAVRSLIEAGSRRKPLVLAFEDIHWADEGMLDLIEYLARWVRGPVLIVCLARDELLDRRPGLGRRAAQRDVDLARAARPRARRASWSRRCSGGAAAATAGDLVAAGRRALRRQPAVRRGDGQPAPRGGRRATSQSCPRPCTPCSPPGSTRSPRRSAASLQHAAVVGQTFWEGSLARSPDDEGVDLARRARRAAGEGHRRARAPASRLAGEREYAFKHVLIRDVAYGMLPKAVRARKHFEVGALHRGARRRPLRGGRRAGRRALRPRRRARRRRRTSSPRSSSAIDAKALAVPRGGRRRRRGAVLEPRGAATTTRPRSRSSRELDPATRARGSPRSRATSRCGSAGWTRRSRSGRSASSTTAGRRTSPGSATCTARSAPGLWHKGEREGSIEHYQKGINLLKDGPPCLELVRLYEEAASLYMHTGDNMLAIYASEKALRLAERLGEAAAASRAHGIFGRVFGRIGDTEKARENLERSVELARDSDPGEAVRALLDARPPPRGLRGRLRGRRRTPTSEALDARRSRSATCRPRSSCTPRSPSSPLYRGDWETVERGGRGERRRSPSARAWSASSASRTCCAACCAGARASLDEAAESLRRRAAELGRAGRLVRGRVRGAVLARRRAARARRSRRRRHRAGPGARRVRARRPGRPVDRGDLRARGQARAAGAGSTRRARPPRRPSGLAERLHYPVGKAASLEAARSRRPARRSYSGRRGMPGTRSAALATPSAANAYLRTARRSNNEQRARR